MCVVSHALGAIHVKVCVIKSSSQVPLTWYVKKVAVAWPTLAIERVARHALGVIQASVSGGKNCILVQYPCFVNMGAVDWSILDNDWCLCTACLHMDHLDRRSSHFDRVSAIHEHQRTATLVSKNCCRSKDESLLRPGVRMMLCQTFYAIGHACSANVVKP